MKKLIAIVAIILAIAAAYCFGRAAGARHAIETATPFVVDLPERNQYGGFDEDTFALYIEFGDQVHEYDAFIC